MLEKASPVVGAGSETNSGHNAEALGCSQGKKKATGQVSCAELVAVYAGQYRVCVSLLVGLAHEKLESFQQCGPRDLDKAYGRPFGVEIGGCGRTS